MEHLAGTSRKNRSQRRKRIGRKGFHHEALLKRDHSFGVPIRLRMEADPHMISFSVLSVPSCSRELFRLGATFRLPERIRLD